MPKILRAALAIGFDVRISRASLLDILQTRAKALEARVEDLQSEIVASQQRVEQLEEQNQRALTSEGAHRARAQWLKSTYEEIIARQRQEFGKWVRTIMADLGIGQNVKLMEKKRNIVVLLTATSQITQLRALAGSKLLREAYNLVVVAYSETSESGILDVCKQHELQLFSSDLKALHGGKIVPEGNGRHDVLLEGVELAVAKSESNEVAEMREIVKLFTEVRHQSSVAANVQRLLLATDADLVLLFEDNAEYVTGIWVSAARNLSIPSVILPYTIADQIEAAEAYYLNKSHWPDEGIYNRLAKIAMPHWLYLHGDRWLLRRSGVGLVAAEALGVAPPMPWILNSSRATAIAVESEAMRGHYLAQEIPEHQLVSTGSVTDDLLHAASKSKDELRRELGLKQDLPVLLCSIPPNQLTVPRPQCQFSDFRSIVDFWLGELRCIEGWQVILKLHPSIRTEDVDYLKRFDVKISELETTSLLPLCDLYNPSVSSTIRWALACGKPVLNYDVYKYYYRDFVSEPAVLTVFDTAEFSGALQSLTSDTDMLRSLTDQAKATAPRWGNLDGRSMERIVGLANSLTEGRGLSARTSI